MFPLILPYYYTYTNLLFYVLPLSTRQQWDNIGGLQAAISYSQRGFTFTPSQNEDDNPAMYTIVGDYCFDASVYHTLVISFIAPPGGNFGVLLDFAAESCTE